MRKYALLLLLPAVFWGLNFHLAGVMLAYSNVAEAGFWRYAFGVGALLVLGYRQGLPKIAEVRKDGLTLFLVGFVGLFLFNYFFFLGLDSTSAINGSLIVSLNPACTLLMARMVLGTPIKANHWMGIGLALIGAIYFLSEGNLQAFWGLGIGSGDGLMLVATLLFAFHHVWVKKYKGPLDNQQFTFATNLLCFLGFVCIMPIYEFGHVSTYPAAYWLAGATMGVIGTAIAYYIWNLGIEHLGAPQTGIYINLVPVATVALAAFFDEPISEHQIVGGLIIIVGVVIMQRRSAR